MSLDVKVLLSSPDDKKEEVLKNVFSSLLGLKQEEVVNALTDFLKELQKNANDNQYKNVCKINLKIISSLPDNVAKQVIAMRLQAQNSLPKDMKARDQKVLNDAINESPYREKILKLLS
ncbi:MAG: transcriptional regulator [Caldisphaera sp.]|uniref:transcriptional regulator n=1 Tax=Caldisphaera sp. TaxID=2060322 RepID=UPI003D116250